DIERSITRLRQQMVAAAKQMEFMEAARLRDEIIGMEKLLESRRDDGVLTHTDTPV
ncbi:MAG: UvrB/UvrC motif-containing protein, partial [Paramuribaculum sp.]|nr:UvrB/UvrC motif-containing protein [Paramuribaculum sp.]